VESRRINYAKKHPSTEKSRHVSHYRFGGKPKPLQAMAGCWAYRTG